MQNLQLSELTSINYRSRGHQPLQTIIRELAIFINFLRNLVYFTIVKCCMVS